MPQVDLETLVSSVCAGGSDRKIACETLADDDSTHDPISVSAASPIDFPPESYSLSKEAQVEWMNENAFFERKESQKGNSSSAPNSNLNSSSQRISLKSKTSIISLPKPQKACFNEAKKRRNCRIASTLMIPKRIRSRLKSDPSLSEPSSPKVSCIGRVRSKRDRSRRFQRQKSGRTDSFKSKPDQVKKPGFFASFKAIFRTGTGCKDVREAHAPQRKGTPPRRSSDIRSRLPMEDVEKSSPRNSTGSRRSSDIRSRLPAEDVEKSSPPRNSTGSGRSSDIRSRLPAEDVEKSSPPRNSTGSRKSLDGGEPVLLGLGGMKRFTLGRKQDSLIDV